MIDTGKILVLAYPDTFVTLSDEWLCKLLPLVGLGTKEYIKAGHAALILVENSTGIAKYYDFGRYVTPEGYGRVRGANTDVELELPFKAKTSGLGNLENFEEFLLWLDANPKKTHGEGRLLASVCDHIDFEKAQSFILKLQQQGSIPYGAFNKEGSNCSRFVTDTILTSTHNKSITKSLKWNKKFTPSGIGNVEKSTFSEVYEVYNGTVKLFNGSAFKENLKNYFHRKKEESNDNITLPKLPKSAQKLNGIGSNAWFELITDYLPVNHYRIRRYNDLQEIDFDGVYVTSEGFDAFKSFQFTYDSHCEYCHVIQNNNTIKLKRVASYAEFNLLQKVHSA